MRAQTPLGIPGQSPHLSLCPSSLAQLGPWMLLFMWTELQETRGQGMPVCQVCLTREGLSPSHVSA